MTLEQLQHLVEILETLVTQCGGHPSSKRITATMKQIMEAPDYTDLHLEFRTGLEDDENGQYAVWIATWRTLKGKCSMNHNHWEYHTSKHTNLLELCTIIITKQMIEKEKDHENH